MNLKLHPHTFWHEYNKIYVKIMKQTPSNCTNQKYIGTLANILAIIIDGLYSFFKGINLFFAT